VNIINVKVIEEDGYEAKTYESARMWARNGFDNVGTIVILVRTLIHPNATPAQREAIHQVGKDAAACAVQLARKGREAP